MRRPHPILGVCMASPSSLDLAADAMRRWWGATGCDAVLICPPLDGGKVYLQKLRLPELVRPGPVCFFDADLWFQRPVRPWDYLAPGAFCAVLDPGRHNTDTFSHSDSKALGMDPDKYFNSGIFVCDTSQDCVRDAFNHALWLSGNRNTPVNDFGEQSFLNAGVQKFCRFTALPHEWNVGPWCAIAGMEPTIPARPLALHAMGVPGHCKRERLDLWERAFAPDLAPDMSTYNLH